MKNITPFPKAQPVVQPDVVVLNCPLQLHFDPVPLQRLFAQKSKHSAEEVVCRMLEDIALRLDILQRAMAVRHFADMGKPARRIAMVSRELGLIEVAVAASHVRTAVASAQGVAIDATVARLERGFDAAVTEVWNFRDL